MPRRTLILLFATVAILVAGLIGLRGLLSPADPDRAGDAPAEEEPQEPEEAGLERAPEIPSGERSTAPVEAQADDPATEGPDPSELEAAWWVEGRVLIPEGTPADEALEVEAVGRRFSDRSPHRAKVAADGSFRAAFHEKSRRGRLRLHGRYLYLPETVRIDVREPPADLVLEPLLGGCIVGTLSLPANAPGGPETAEGTVVELTGFEQNREDSSVPLRRAAEIDGDLGFVLGGLPARREYSVYMRPESYVQIGTGDLRVEAGGVRAVRLELQVGVRLTGRVVDEQGEAVPGVLVHAGTDDLPFSLFDRGGSEVESDEDGRFDARGVAPGDVGLYAHPDGYKAAQWWGDSLSDGEHRDGIQLVLGRGAGLAGRVQWPDGSPARGAVIELVGEDVEGPDFGSMEPLVTAAADGSFEVTGLEAGTYLLRARARPELPEGEVDERGRRKRWGAFWHAELKGIPVPARDLLLVLREGSSLSGVAVDESGAAIERFTVLVEPAESDVIGAWTPPIQRSFRGTEGRFELDGLRAGEWSVVAEARGHDLSAVQRVTTPPGAAGLTLVLPHTARIAGKVVDSQGRPVAGALVTAEREREHAFVFEIFDEVEATTDELGRFELEEVPVGLVRVRARAEGGAPAESDAIEVRAGAIVENLVIALPAVCGLTGEVLDSGGSPAEGYTVTLKGLDREKYENARTDASGRFSFLELEPGRYELESSPPHEELYALLEREGEAGYESWRGLCATETVELLDGQELQLVLGGLPPGPVRVHGTVRAGGEPVAGARVWVSGRGLDEYGEHLECDENGRFEIVLREPGAYDFGLHAVDGEGMVTFREEVPAVAEWQLDFQLPTGAVSGTVFGPDGSPLEGVRLSLQIEGPASASATRFGWAQAASDARGGYRFGSLAPGTYRVRAGGLAAWQDETEPAHGIQVRGGVRVEPGAAVEGVDLHLGGSGAISGIVRTREGEPAAGAVVRVRDERGHPLTGDPFHVETDEDGRFRAAGLPEGRVLVSAAKGHQVTTSPAVGLVIAGAQAEVELVLEAGSVLVVTVVSPSGEAVHAGVVAYDSRGFEHRPGDLGHAWWLDPARGSRELRIGPLPPGAYRVVARGPGGAMAERETSLGSEPEQRLELQLR